MRFDVYAMPSGAPPYVVDVQSDFLSHLTTRVVIPLVPAGKQVENAAGLQPVFEIAGEPHILVTNHVTSIIARDLKRSITSLARHRDDITRALDLLLTGF